MSNRVPPDSPLAGPFRDRAMEAWRRLDPGRSPKESAEILQVRSKSVICRLQRDGAGTAVIAKRCDAKTARLEHGIYTGFLASALLPALRCYGMVPETEGDSSWIFLEDAGGGEYSPALQEHRALAGRWLAGLHRGPVPDDLQALLPDRGSGYYLPLLRSARAELQAWAPSRLLLPADAALLRTVAARCQALEDHWEELAGFCDQMPRCVVHGDFAKKNLRVQARAGGLALLVFDWEMAGWGTPAADLAQFVGRCASPDLDAYAAALGREVPRLDAREIKALANYGALLRIVEKTHWETRCLMGDSYRFLSKPLLTLRKYDAQLSAALRALGWEHDD